jgi:hypothetical protein
VEKGIGGGCAPIPFSIHLDASLYLGCIAQIQDEVDTPPQPAILSICVRILDQGRNERIPLFQLGVLIDKIFEFAKIGISELTACSIQ